MPRTSVNDRLRAVGMIQGGASISAIARQFGVERLTVRRWLTNFQLQGNVTDLPRSGRPRITTPQQDRYILLTHLRNRHLPATVTARNIPGLRVISAVTVRRRLCEQGLRAYRPARCTVLTHRHRQLRLQWARQHFPFTVHQWRHVLFTDESRFNLSTADGRHRVYRRVAERYADQAVVELLPYGGGSIMVWGGFTARHRTQLVIIRGNLNALRYRNEIVRCHIEPFIRVHGPQVILQQDNARPHIARVVREELELARIATLPWPANSPDMAPIEHAWDELQRRIHRLPRAPATLGDLAGALQQEWRNIPQAFFARLVTSMRRRCLACIAANGGHTRY
jgi:transposase-like protein